MWFVSNQIQSGYTVSTLPRVPLSITSHLPTYSCMRVSHSQVYMILDAEKCFCLFEDPSRYHGPCDKNIITYAASLTTRDHLISTKSTSIQIHSTSLGGLRYFCYSSLKNFENKCAFNLTLMCSCFYIMCMTCMVSLNYIIR